MLAMKLVYQAPVHRCRAGSQGLVRTVAIPHALYKREAVWQLQANFSEGQAILRHRMRGSSAARGIVGDGRPLSLDTTARQQASDIFHHQPERLHMLRGSTLRIRRRLKRSVTIALAPTMESRRVPIRSEKPAQKLAHHRHRAARLQHEGREGRILLNALLAAHAQQAADCIRQWLRQHDGPSSLIRARGHWATTGEQLNIVKNRFTIHDLPHIHAALPVLADRASTEQVTEQARKSQGAQTLPLRLHCEGQFADAQHIPGLILALLVQWRFKTNHHAVPPWYEFVGAHPAPVRAENLMVWCADQGAPILENKGDAFSLALNHHLRLSRLA